MDGIFIQIWWRDMKTTDHEKEVTVLVIHWEITAKFHIVSIDNNGFWSFVYSKNPRCWWRHANERWKRLYKTVQGLTLMLGANRPSVSFNHYCPLIESRPGHHWLRFNGPSQQSLLYKVSLFEFLFQWFITEATHSELSVNVNTFQCRLFMLHFVTIGKLKRHSISLRQERDIWSVVCLLCLLESISTFMLLLISYTFRGVSRIPLRKGPQTLPWEGGGGGSEIQVVNTIMGQIGVGGKNCMKLANIFQILLMIL